MMLPIALALAQFAPMLAGLLAGPKAEAVAGKVVEIAQTVTGQPTPEAALKAVQLSPEIAAQFQKAVLDQQVELEKLAVEQIRAVNQTMQAEAASEHWPTYSWRPFIGFMFGSYIGSMWLLPLFGKTPAVLSADLTLAVGAILGVASWFRGRMQADPNIPTVNRG